MEESGRNKLLCGETRSEQGCVLVGGFLEELCRFRVEEEVFENEIDEEKDRNLAENEALGKRWGQGEDVVAHWCRDMNVNAARSACVIPIITCLRRLVANQQTMTSQGDSAFLDF